jgi:hypothetical protein
VETLPTKLLAFVSGIVAASVVEIEDVKGMMPRSVMGAEFAGTTGLTTPSSSSLTTQQHQHPKQRTGVTKDTLMGEPFFASLSIQNSV